MTKTYNFHESYPGPLGPHLDYLSKYTLTRKEEHRLQGRSIRGEGENTCKKPTAGHRERVIAALQSHLLRHPADKQSETHLLSLGGKPLEAA